MSVTISGSGQIIKQVVQTVKTDTFSSASTSYTDITGLSVSITPTNSANKILVILGLCATAGGAGTTFGARITRNTTAIFVGDAAGSRTPTSTVYGRGISVNDAFGQPVTYLDSPATTSTLTYTVQIRPEGGTAYVNRSSGDSDSAAYYRGASSITVMEVAYA